MLKQTVLNQPDVEGPYVLNNPIDIHKVRQAVVRKKMKKQHE
jgi:hypothetical protein